MFHFLTVIKYFNRYITLTNKIALCKEATENNVCIGMLGFIAIPQFNLGRG